MASNKQKVVQQRFVLKGQLSRSINLLKILLANKSISRYELLQVQFTIPHLQAAMDDFDKYTKELIKETKNDNLR